MPISTLDGICARLFGSSEIQFKNNRDCRFLIVYNDYTYID